MCKKTPGIDVPGVGMLVSESDYFSNFLTMTVAL